MELKIRHNRSGSHKADAAFIRGQEASEWLRVIDGWQVPVENLGCLIIGEKHNPAIAAGLLVIFEKGSIPSIGRSSHEFTCVAGKLYIPVDAELMPALSKEELSALLIWDYQVFHPVYGFVGFDATDKRLVKDLIGFTSPQPVAWNFAVKGVDLSPPLLRFQIQAPTLEEVLEQVKGEINVKDIQDLKPPSNNTVLDSLLNTMGRTLLTGGMFLLGGVGGVLGVVGGLGGLGGGMPTGRSRGPGLFDKLGNWMKEKLEDLQKKRDSELKRLVDLFDKNSDEALEYAIPLDSPYLNRGTSSPSSSLGRRSTNFSLGGLGGGTRADIWDADKYRSSLRAKYLMAANDAAAAGNYRKAAYVYAHLLGDYYGAARMLEEGKFYREAAALFKDHLKNIPAAAECLERGGMLQDAIELYDQLGKYEKSGDLYSRLQQKDKAEASYERCIGQAASNKDYLEVARIAQVKLSDTERASVALLDGWRDVKKPEECLTQYFDLAAAKEGGVLTDSMQLIYEKETPYEKKMSLLNVLYTVTKKYAGDEVADKSREIAYEVTCEQIKNGHVQNLYQLKRFVDDDHLIGGDITRFVRNYKTAVDDEFVNLPASFRMMKEVTWYRSFHWGTQLLFLGYSATGHYLARANKRGHVEYEVWNAEQHQADRGLDLIFHPFSRNFFLIGGGASLHHKKFGANDHFSDELLFHNPTWLPSSGIGMAKEENEVVVLYNDGEHSVLSWFNLYGTLNKRVDCDGFISRVLDDVVVYKPMVSLQHHYYLAMAGAVARISPTGKISILKSPHAIRLLIADQAFPNEVFLCTSHGCLIVDTTGQDLCITGDLFAMGVDVIDMKIIEGKLVLMASKRVSIYDIRNRQPVLINNFVYEESRLVSVSAGILRHMIALLDDKGVVSFHEIGE